MNVSLKRRLYFWGGLLAIMALYCLYYLYFIDGLSLQISLRARHIGKFLFIIVAYLTGLYALKKQVPGWVILIWHFLYGGILLMLLSFGMYDWAMARASVPMRIIAYDLQELLVSPIVYVALVFLGNFYKG